MRFKSISPQVVKESKKKLYRGITQLGLRASCEQIDQFIQYLQLWYEWNGRINLTGRCDPLTMVNRHLLDSLAIKPYLGKSPILDVGTGAGLPGIPLSILMPGTLFFLLDSNHKKQVFVSQVVKLLSLNNVECVHSEVKAYEPTQKFSTILTRAFAPLTQMIHLTAHLLADNGRFFAMLGKSDKDLAFPKGFEMERMVSLKVPYEQASRHLGIIVKAKGL